MDGPRHGSLNKTPNPLRRIGDRWMWWLAHFALLVCLFALSGPLPAIGREIVIQHFDERVVIGADGTTEVTETIEAEFIGENWHGIYRTIPVEYTTPQGINYTLFLELISVTDAASPTRLASHSSASGPDEGAT